jgi:hypothetical protein
MLMLILANALALTTLDPLDTAKTKSTSARRVALENFMNTCAVIFMLDNLVSLIAHGAYFAGPGSHLRSSWNKVCPSCCPGALCV